MWLMELIDHNYNYEDLWSIYFGSSTTIIRRQMTLKLCVVVKLEIIFNYIFSIDE